jgi:hypothetical protein
MKAPIPSAYVRKWDWDNSVTYEGAIERSDHLQLLAN